MDFLNDLKQFTHARIALKRAGNSLSTKELLDFKLAHSKAKDSVWKELDVGLLKTVFTKYSSNLIEVQSQCKSKKEFLLRPDLGRTLAPESLLSWDSFSKARAGVDCLLILADGLSASAIQTQALPFVEPFLAGAKKRGVSMGPLVIARYSRVALGDILGETLKAKSILVLIGERPGLASPESMSVYFTYEPKASRTDAERNCISNIQKKGVAPEVAAQMALFLLEQSLKKKLSGIDLKVEYSEMASLKKSKELGP